MRKSLTAALLAALLLPGCVFAIGNGPDDEQTAHKIKQMEKQVAALEQQLAQCEVCAAGAK